MLNIRISKKVKLLPCLNLIVNKNGLGFLWRFGRFSYNTQNHKRTIRIAKGIYWRD